MTPGADVWVFEASFCVTCPTFRIGYVISCPVQHTVLSKTSLSAGLWHMHKSDSYVVFVQMYAVHHVFCMRHICLSFVQYFSSVLACPLFSSQYLPLLCPFLFIASNPVSKSSVQRCDQLPWKLPSPTPADGGCGRCSNLSVRQCCQATGHMVFPSNNSTAGTCQSS